MVSRGSSIAAAVASLLMASAALGAPEPKAGGVDGRIFRNESASGTRGEVLRLPHCEPTRRPPRGFSRGSAQGRQERSGHRAGQSRGKPADSQHPARNRSDETETELYEVFTGSLAIQQALQRATLTGRQTVDDQNIPISELKPPRLRSLDYEELLKTKREDGIEPKVHEVSKLVPHDQYLLHFNSLSALDKAIDLSTEWGDSLLRLFTVQAQDNRVKEKFEQQLVIDHQALVKLFQDGVGLDVALTGSDPTILEGTGSFGTHPCFRFRCIHQAVTQMDCRSAQQKR